MDFVSVLVAPEILNSWFIQLLKAAGSLVFFIGCVTAGLKLKEIGFKVLLYAVSVVGLLATLNFGVDVYLMYSPGIGLVLIMAFLLVLGPSPKKNHRRRYRH